MVCISRPHPRPRCNELGWSVEAGECLLGSRVQEEGYPICLSTFKDRMADEWVFNMIGFCDGHSGNLCTRLVENGPP